MPKFFTELSNTGEHNEHTANAVEDNGTNRENEFKSKLYGNETTEQLELLLNAQTDLDRTSRKNDVHKNKNISQTNLDNRPWKIVLQNTRGLLTENSNKLKMIKEYAKDEK